MSDRTIPGRVQDLDLVEQMLGRIASPEEADAARRVLGLDREADRLAAAYWPAHPPHVSVGLDFDHLAVAHAAVDRYTAWVASYPDDDPTPMATRERTLRLARRDLERLAT